MGYGYTEKENFGFSEDNKVNKADNKTLTNGTVHATTNGCADTNGWYRDVVELRKKAGEYKVNFNINIDCVVVVLKQ